jgi:hypothetical protein
MRWSFGRTADSVRTGYVLEPAPDGGPAASAAAARALYLKVSFGGHACTGTYQPDLGLLTVHLVGATSATIVYRILDDDSACSNWNAIVSGPLLLRV